MLSVGDSVMNDVLMKYLKDTAVWRHDTQHNNIRHNGIQQRGLYVTISIRDSQHK